MSRPIIHNWAESFGYEAATLHHPRSIAEVQELVARVTRAKAIGTRHSFSRVSDSPGGALISLAQVETAIEIDADRQIVAVGAGTTYGALAAVLEKRGFALDNLASLPHISIAGAVATATHGSGDTNGVLARAVNAVELVRPDGSMVRIERPDPELDAIAAGVGAFGVITRLELDIEPSYTVRQHIYANASWDLVIENLDDVMASAYSVSLLGDLHEPTLRRLWLKQRVDAKAPEPPDTFYGGTWWDGADLPPDHSLTQATGIPGPWSERMAHFRMDGVPSVGGDELQSEHFVDRAHGPNALRALRPLAEHISPHLHGMEIRTVAADELWLSPAYQRPSLCLGFTWRKHAAEVAALLPEIERVLEPYEPRPHWGKLFAMRDLDGRFPRLGDFRELMAEYDPRGKFRNPFLDRIV